MKKKTENSIAIKHIHNYFVHSFCMQNVYIYIYVMFDDDCEGSSFTFSFIFFSFLKVQWPLWNYEQRKKICIFLTIIVRNFEKNRI